MTTCPKCGYARKPSDTAPEWECPACGIAYAKFHETPPAAPAIGLVESAREDDEDGRDQDSPVVHWVLFGLSLLLTWAVTMVTGGLMSNQYFGFISGIDLGRVILVSLDLYFAGSALNSLLDQIKRPITESHHRLMFAAGCVAVAFTLHYTGTLAKTYSMLGLAPPGPAASIGMLRSHQLHAEVPNLPLEEFAGDWFGVFQARMAGTIGHGPGAITRVHVSVENGAARMQIWRWCPPRECDSGTFPAILESRHHGTVVALHVTGTEQGTDWLVSLSSQKNHLMLEEQRLRGTDLMKLRQSSDWMNRQPP